MRHRVTGLALAWALAIGSAVTAGRAQTVPLGRSVRDGVYSAAQAERGAAAYQRACAMCHRLDLQGNPDAEVPPLVDDAFLVPWEKNTVGDLVNRISRTMPGNRPGSLSRPEYLDIVGHILKANRFPAGPGDLPQDGDALAQIAIGKP